MWILASQVAGRHEERLADGGSEEAALRADLNRSGRVSQVRPLAGDLLEHSELNRAMGR